MKFQIGSLKMISFAENIYLLNIIGRKNTQNPQQCTEHALSVHLANKSAHMLLKHVVDSSKVNNIDRQRLK